MLAIGMISTASLMNSCSKNNNDSTPESPTPEKPIIEKNTWGANINKQEAQKEYMILITEKKPSSEQIELYIEADKNDQNGVWIDLNNDVMCQDNEKVSVFGGLYQKYTFSNNIMTMIKMVK